jgi:hypothetical protein
MILRKYKDSRDNDNILFARYIFEFNKEFLKTSGDETYVSLSVFPHLPSFESISRARRKAQEEEKELAASEDVQFARAVKRVSCKLNFRKK